MLTQLTVSNYAIAERVELQFSKGMTALTGETGAGKSIVLDALGLAMGGLLQFRLRTLNHIHVDACIGRSLELARPLP